MILLSCQRWPPAVIAELLGCDPATVRRWIHRYNQYGVAGLTDRPRCGRPRLGSRRVGERILRLLAQPRAWTVARLWQRLGRPAMSLRTLHRRVREVACWRRPRLVAKGDPDHDQVLAALRQTIAALPEGAVVLAEDETHLNLLPWVRATWIPAGQRQPVLTPGTNRRRTIFGAIDVASGRFFYQAARKAVSATFIAFLEQLAAAYPAAPVVAVVCDNVIIHHSKVVQRWLAAHPAMIVLHGARYSPHDNPVERIWAALKAWLANSPTLTIQGRLRQVHAFFHERTPPRCWRLPRRTAHHGCPRVTCRTSRRPLSVTGMRSRTAVHRRRAEATANEGDRRGSFPQLKAAVVGLAGLEPAASSLSAITRLPLCNPAFSQVVGDRQGRSNAFLATPSQAVQAGKAIPYSLAREVDVDAADNTQHDKQQNHPPETGRR
jgi:transposase